jgi:hypothetical protein
MLAFKRYVSFDRRGWNRGKGSSCGHWGGRRLAWRSLWLGEVGMELGEEWRCTRQRSNAEGRVSRVEVNGWAGWTIGLRLSVYE